MRYLVAGMLFLLAGCASSPPVAFPIQGLEVESWEPVETDDMNAQIDRAVAAGETWPQSPLLSTIELLRGDRDARVLRIDEEKNRAEGADTTVVVVIRDGLRDDSVRGDWHRVVYERVSDQKWRVHSARRAFRCHRGHHLESFSSERCP
jgi:hypothetical protein